jgi:hypothetical protein
MTDLLAEAADELYRADPEQFTQRRAELAARAREAGETAAAKQITALRKPTRSAWVVNRLVRADPQVCSRLAAMAAELRDSARSAARIRELTEARSRLVDELTRQALDVAGLDAPAASLREEVTRTLDAAIADPQVAANLGTLVRAANWAGFGLDLAAPLPPPPPAKPKARAPAEAAEDRDRRRREKISSAERALAEAHDAAATIAGEEQDLEDTVRRLEAELAQARERLAEARRRAYRAETRQRRAGEELARLRQQTLVRPTVNLCPPPAPLIQVRRLSRAVFGGGVARGGWFV